MSPLPRSHHQCSPICREPLGCDPEKRLRQNCSLVETGNKWPNWSKLWPHIYHLTHPHLINNISQSQYSICPESFWGGPGTMAVPTNKTCYWGWMIDLRHTVVWINNNLCSRIMPTTAIAPVSQSVYCGDHLVIYAPWIFAAELWRLSPSGSDAGTAATKLWAILAAWK